MHGGDFLGVEADERQSRQRQREWRRVAFALLVITPVSSTVISSEAVALELPKPELAEKYLGKASVGANYTVKPVVRSDGVMRIFDVDTSYGKFTFDGVEFTKLRLHELPSLHLKKCPSRMPSARHSGVLRWAR